MKLRETDNVAVFPEQTGFLLISVNKTIGNPGLSLYDAVRYSWKISRQVAANADYLMAVVRGRIVGVFQAEEWMPAVRANFPDISDDHGNWKNQKNRWGFRGHEASGEVQKRYRGKLVPSAYRHRQNPIRYVNS